jgi:hypothetical protein
MASGALDERLSVYDDPPIPTPPVLIPQEHQSTMLIEARLGASKMQLHQGEIERLVGALGLAARKARPAPNKYLPVFGLQEAQDWWDDIIANCNRENPDTTLH